MAQVVERYFREVEVASSSLVIPIRIKSSLRMAAFLFIYFSSFKNPPANSCHHQVSLMKILIHKCLKIRLRNRP